MNMRFSGNLGTVQAALRRSLLRVEVLAFFPIMLILTDHFLGREALLVASMILPALMAVLGIGVAGRPSRGRWEGTGERGVLRRNARETMAALLDRIAAMPDVDSACFLIEIDDWQRMTDLCGRQASEDFGAVCGARLRAALRADDLVGDLGPGRYGIVLHPIDLATLKVREAIADRLRAGLSAPLDLDGTTVCVTACIGHAALRGDGTASGDDVIARADAALREARAAGPNASRAHVPGRTAAGRSHAPLAEEVAGALQSGAVLPWFQPQVDARTGAPVGFEALARWDHPELGLLTPARFLDSVAEAGQMPGLGRVIRKGAIEALVGWRRAGFDTIGVSVNACADELRDPAFAEQVAWDLDAAELPADALVVEVLESVASDAREEAILSTLRDLRRHGIALDLDDFGVGQASLLSIRRFGIGRIKIDRSFVTGIDGDPERRLMVQGILSLARGLRVSVVAEGVETRAERAALTGMGCDVLQGHGIGMPMPLSEATAWLMRAETARRTVAPAPVLLRPAT